MARERKFSTQELFTAVGRMLIQHGYEGFTISLLADHLDVSRGALYKYYENKDELIVEYMNDKMDQFLLELREIERREGFEAQFDYLIELIFHKHSQIHQLIGMAHQIQAGLNDRVKAGKKRLDEQHLVMYAQLKGFTDLGRRENKLKPHLADGIVLGMIFQTIAIPNHYGIPQAEWVASIKEILCQGMFTSG
jgi:TetR/AcrR family transcriptional regulator, repressor of fatR-cypB operon